MTCCDTHEGHGCCCCCGQMTRKYLTRKEETELLERYLEELKKETEAVEERLKELRSK